MKEDESRIRLMYGPIILIPIRSIAEIEIKSRINNGIFFLRTPNMTNILFTGSAGFSSFHLTKLFSDDGFDAPD